MTISTTDQTTTPNSATPPTKIAEQLPTPSKMVPPNLLRLNITPQRLQDNILDTIKAIPAQPSRSPKLL